jgi:hypothetical protein
MKPVGERLNFLPCSTSFQPSLPVLSALPSNEQVPRLHPGGPTSLERSKEEAKKSTTAKKQNATDPAVTPETIDGDRVVVLLSIGIYC